MVVSPKSFKGCVKSRSTQTEKAAEADIEQQAARKQQGNAEASYVTKKGEGQRLKREIHKSQYLRDFVSK